MTYNNKTTRFMLEHKKRQYDEIIKRYGTGVRPSHVSTDLAILGYEIEYLENELAKGSRLYEEKGQ
jgi:hypothetical protein